MDELTPPENEETRLTKPQTLMRVRQVQLWMVDGMSNTQIVEHGMQKWDIGRSMVYRYIKEAYALFKEETAEDIEVKRRLYIERGLQLYCHILQKEKPGFASSAVRLLKELATLEGLYATLPKPKEEDKVTHVTLDLGRPNSTLTHHPNGRTGRTTEPRETYEKCTAPQQPETPGPTPDDKTILKNESQSNNPKSTHMYREACNNPPIRPLKSTFPPRPAQTQSSIPDMIGVNSNRHSAFPHKPRFP